MMLVMRILKSPLIRLYKEGMNVGRFVLPAMLLVAVSFSINTAYAAKLYKWVDENGQVHFSDKIPPQEIKRQHSEVDKHGLETKTVEAAKTPGEIAEERRQLAIKAEQDRIAKEQAERDRILLDTFSNEDEIINARDRQLATMEASNQITAGSIDSLTLKLQEQTKNAADYERQAQEVPKNILKDIDDIKLQIEQHRASIKAKEQEQVKLREKYQAYIDRFRELKGL